ncbi:MAG: hypothetical protein IIT71_04685, partial [Acetobacter sp.]|nr:hypothetical protein [Acetobacter sp.]
AFISSLGGIGSLGNHYLSGFNHVAALAQVAVCLPPPSLYLDWGKLGGAGANMNSQLSAAMMLVIPAHRKITKITHVSSIWGRDRITYKNRAKQHKQQ